MGGLRVTYAQGMYVPMRVGEQLEPLRCSQARLLEWVSTLCRVPRVPTRERCEVITPLQNGRCGGGSGRCEQVSAPDLALEEQEAGNRDRKQTTGNKQSRGARCKQRLAIPTPGTAAYLSTLEPRIGTAAWPPSIAQLVSTLPYV